MDVGATLRRARTEKRLTLDQLSRATKITASKLRALEENDFERLPAPVYTRGFLRAYAREVGLDPQETVAQYMQQVDEALAMQLPEPEPPPGEPARRPGLHPHQNQHDVDAPAGSMLPRVIDLRNLPFDLRNLPRPAVAAAGVMLLVALIGSYFWGGNADEDLATARAAQQSAAPVSSAPPPANDAAPATNVIVDGLRIELKTTGPCWVSATADRLPVLSRLLQAGEVETIEAKDELVLRVGDPGTINLSVNGEPLRPLGRAGLPVTVQINRQNYRAYLAG